MTTVDSLPERPLTPAEVKQLSGAESIEYVMVVSEIGPPPRVVSVEVSVGSERVLLGYGPDPFDPDGGWSVIDRRAAEGT